MRPIIFLDIDGVLNDHKRHVNGYCGTGPACVAAFNRILAAVPDARIVVTSAWRYIADFHGITTRVLENVLLTHGVDCYGRVAGYVRPDVSAQHTDRGPQITEWLLDRAIGDPFLLSVAYVVLDDKDLEIASSGHPFVQTDGDAGLTDTDADQAIGILTAAVKAGAT